ASPEYRAVVTVDSNLNEYTSVYTENNVLNIGTKNGINCIFTKYIVDVYCPGVEAVSLSGSVSFEAKDKINSSSFKVDMSGFGKIDGNFECDDFSVSISGSGDMNCNVVCSAFSADVSGDANITFSGTVNSMDISISGAGDFNGSELRTNSAAVSTSGSATIRVWVLDTLKAVISGSGKVIYRGTPKIDYKSSGAGRLESV
ncbi:MAG: DUF2807 domain-containing protein, partial [Treponema sp.]|nr:DUF2807 domain-containing protein [Treponema sp.]